MSEISPPYCLFLADATDPKAIKTASGVVEWDPALAACEFALPGCTVSTGIPRAASLSEAAEKYGAKTLVVGVVTNTGSTFPASWQETFIKAMHEGLDVASGMHAKLEDQMNVVHASRIYGRNLHDFRYSPKTYGIGKGVKRSGFRLLTVGQDCNIGKKYTAIALYREMTRQGLDASFCYTGQTGALIYPESRGVVLDTTPADFLTGAVEWMSPAANRAHWDIIEGQGSFLNPSFGQVSLALLLGSQPDYLVMCVDPTREWLRGTDYSPLPLEEDIDLNLLAARRTNPDCKLLGISINYTDIDERLRPAATKTYFEVAQKYGAVVFDPNSRSMMSPAIDRVRRRTYTSGPV